MSTAKNCISILNIFLEQRSLLNIYDIVRLTGLSRGVVYRMISILQENKYIIHSNKKGKYIPGPKFIEFSNLLKDLLDIKDIVLPFVKNLRDLVDESIYTDILDYDKSVVIASVEGKKQLRVVPDIYRERPLYCSASGKIYLANMSRKEQESYISENKKFIHYTPNTITNYAELRKQLIEIKQEGIAYDREELTPGIFAIACPLKDYSKNVTASIGIIMPSIRATPERVSEVAPLIKNTAGEISKLLGYHV